MLIFSGEPLYIAQIKIGFAYHFYGNHLVWY